MVVMCLFIRFFIFADPPPDKRDYQSHVREQRQAKLLPETDASASTILEKTYYDVNEHAPESLDWFTVLVAQAIGHFRDYASQGDHLFNSINSLLNGDKIPSFIGPITVSGLDIGQEFPVFSNCRIVSVEYPQEDEDRESPQTPPQSVYVSPNGSTFNTPRLRRSHDFSKPKTRPSEAENILEAQIDVNLMDQITLGIDTKLLINFPRPNFAFLPVNLSVSIVNFSGTLKLSLRNSKKEETGDHAEPADQPSSDNGDLDREDEKPPSKEGAYITFSFAPNYELQFEINSLIGSRSKLQDVTKIAQLVESRLRKIFEERFVYPNEQKVYLPSIFPKLLNQNHQPPPGGANGTVNLNADSLPSNGSAPSASSSLGAASGATPLSHQVLKDHEYHLLHRSQQTQQQRLHPRSFSSASQLASNTAINMPSRPQFDTSQESSDSSAIL